MPTTLNVADKPTLDSVKTDTDTLLTRGGIRHNGTNPQVYDTTNDTWVDLPSGGSLSPTIIIKNHFYQDGDMDNLDITISDDEGLMTTQTVNMGTDDYIAVDVPHLGRYSINCTFNLKQWTWRVNVNTVCGVDGSSKIPNIVSFSTGTDAEISAMLDAYYDDNLTWEDMGWAIGDTRTISLASMTPPTGSAASTWAAQDIVVVIVAHDHTDLATSINGHTKACITVQTREVLNNNISSSGQTGQIYVTGQGSYYYSFIKWSDLYIRKYINNTIFGAFSDNFKAAIKSSKHYRHTNYNTTDVEQVTDNLFLPSYPEIYGTASFSYYKTTLPTEGTQFPYYEITSNRIKRGNNNGAPNGTTQYWWMGSPSSYYSSSYGYDWCHVNTDGSASYLGGVYACGLAPAFAM